MFSPSTLRQPTTLFATHQDTRILRSIDVVWMQGVRGWPTRRGKYWERGMGQESRAPRSSKSTFPQHVASSRNVLSPPFALALRTANPFQFLHISSLYYPPRLLPCSLYIRPPVFLLPSAPTIILLAPSRTIRVIRTPLDISIRHLLGSGCSPRVRERNPRIYKMNPVKRRSFYQYHYRCSYCVSSWCK